MLHYLMLLFLIPHYFDIALNDVTQFNVPIVLVAAALFAVAIFGVSLFNVRLF